MMPGRDATASERAGERRAEDGSTLILTMFYAGLALVLILIVAATTSLYLERKRLFTLADGASLVGAESFDLDRVADGAPGASGNLGELRAADVTAAARAYVADSGRGFTALRIERATTLDARTATVTLSAYWRPPLLTLLVPDGFRIEVTSVARSVFS